MTTYDKIYSRDFNPDTGESLALLAKHIADGSQVLDIGCGAGDLGGYLRSQKHCRVVGMDYSNESLAMAADKLDVTLRIDLNTQLPHERVNETFDVIVLADILEHIYTPDAVLQSAEKLLKPDGKLLISMPNAGYVGALISLYDDCWQYGEEGILDRTHIRFYTKKSVLALLHNNGFAAAVCDRVQRDLLSSEFTQRIDSQVDSVRDWLLAKPEGATYQFIIEARPKTQQYTFAPEPPSPPMSLQHIVKLYWQSDTNAEFNSQQFAALRGEMGKNSRLCFDINCPTIAALRLDFADRRSIYFIDSIEIFDEDELLWSSQQQDYTLTSAQLYSQRQRLPITAMAHNHQAFIHLMLNTPQSGQALSVAVTLSAPVSEQNTTFLDAVSLAQYNSVVQEQQRLADELVKVHKTTGAYLGELQTTLQYERTRQAKQQQRLEELQQQLQNSLAEQASLKQQLAELLASSSWKLTAPIRKIIHLFK